MQKVQYVRLFISKKRRTSLINELGIKGFPDAVFGTLYAEEGRNGGYSELSDIF